MRKVLPNYVCTLLTCIVVHTGFVPWVCTLGIYVGYVHCECEVWSESSGNCFLTVATLIVATARITVALLAGALSYRTHLDDS